MVEAGTTLSRTSVPSGLGVVGRAFFQDESQVKEGGAAVGVNSASCSVLFMHLRLVNHTQHLLCGELGK